MGMLDLVKGISSEPHNRFTVIMGKPGSGKTTLAGTYPKPLLYVSIDTDGGGEVLKGYSDEEIKVLELKSEAYGTPGAKHLQTKLMALLEELSQPHPYRTVVLDAYSSVEEDVVRFLEKAKGKQLNQEEWGRVGKLMLDVRNKLIELSRGDVEYVAISHIKDKKTTDNTTGEEYTQLVPKMTYNNGNLLLERASNVMYSARKTIVEEDGSRRVAFLTYLGAHPNMDTKLRTKGKMADTGIYVEGLTYDKIEEIKNNKQPIDTMEKLNVVESQTNPFSDETETKGTDDEW